MGIKDLYLEFEEEPKGGSTDALDVDIDLSFSAAGDPPIVKSVPKSRVEGSGSSVPIKAVKAKLSVVDDSEDIFKEPLADSGEFEDLRSDLDKLKLQMQNIQGSADLKVAVAEAERDFMLEFVSNAKILDHQVSQILARINKKVPALAPESQMIKKYLNDFLKKSYPQKK